MIKPRICILLNNLREFTFSELLQRYLPADQFDVKLVESFPDNPREYQIIIPWNYQKIIQQIEHIDNIVIFHSSDLPDGRGWAPVYYAFKDQKSEYVISAILAAGEVDRGNIIMRARFLIEDGYTASFVRKIDEELTLLMIVKILEQWPDGGVVSIRQSVNGTYRRRRYPKDNEVNVNETLMELIPHLRGVENNSPAYFFFNNVKYLIEIRPEQELSRPKCITIEYPGLNKIECWSGWA